MGGGSEEISLLDSVCGRNNSNLPSIQRCEFGFYTFASFIISCNDSLVFSVS